MPSPRIPKDMNDCCYFLTFTVNKWVDIFTSLLYFEAIIENLKFYQRKLNLRLFGYVVMMNHIHLIAECNDMIGFVRSFKGYMAYRLLELLKSDNRSYILPLFRDKGRNKFWRNGSWPKLVESENFFRQKLEYIHENPIIKGYVEREEDWLYSSARNYYCDDHSIIEVEVM